MELPMDVPAVEMALPPITPNARYYLQSINGTNYDPTIAADTWSLVVDGLVEQAVGGDHL